MPGPNPRSTIFTGGMPVNYMTGEPITAGQQARLDQLRDAEELLMTIMHEAEGSNTAADSFNTRRMAIAATHLEIAMMMARKAALESP